MNNPLFTLLTTIFMIFGTDSDAQEDLRPGHLIIAGDRSTSMFTPNFSSIEIQMEGIAMGLSDFVPQCGNTRISYFSWGNTPHTVLTAVARTEESRLSLAQTILGEGELNLSATHHANAWNKVRHMTRPNERTTIVFITNGDGLMRILEEIPDTTVYKVALTFATADTYLRDNFLPKSGINRFVIKDEDLRNVIIEALEGLDVPCAG